MSTLIESFITPLLKVTFTDSNGAFVTLVEGVSLGLVGLPPQFANAIYNDLGAELSQGFPIVDCSLALTSTSLNLLFQGITIAIPIGQPIVPGSASSRQLGFSIGSGTSFPGDNALSSM
jgi:hypothetical protein